MNNKFFVYGTLMTGMSNHWIIPRESIVKIEQAQIESMELYMYPYAKYPCMIKGEGTVYGELVTIKGEDLKQVMNMLDRLEYYEENGENNLYNREIYPVKLHDGTFIDANIYLYNDKQNPLGRRIEDGNFKKSITRKLTIKEELQEKINDLEVEANNIEDTIDDYRAQLDHVNEQISDLQDQLHELEDDEDDEIGTSAS